MVSPAQPVSAPAETADIDAPIIEASAGEIFLRRLAANGIDYLFANGGTDFAPVIEGFAHAQVADFKVPTPILIPHETAALGMAHGYYLATGRPQAVMVHTNVGLANCVMGVLNAASDQVPMILASGITPHTEHGPLGHRNSPINWGQNMRDQTAMVREPVKWDATLSRPEQSAPLVDRAVAIATSSPRGPVYLGLPREALCEVTTYRDSKPRNAAARAAPHPEDLAEAARLLDAAERPLIVAFRTGARGGGFAALTAFAERHAIPVVEFWPSQLSIDGASPMHGGFDPGEDLAAADVVLVLDAIVPWLPHRHGFAEQATVIQAGADPHQLEVPLRGFATDLALTGESAHIIAALDEAMQAMTPPPTLARDRSARFARLAERHAARRAQLDSAVRAGPPMSAAFVTRTIVELIGAEGCIVSELGAKPEFVTGLRGDQFFQNPISGGLGWGLPAALGVQLADRDRLVVATVGDGSYMFANPVACHQIAEAHGLPLLTIVYNNGIWGAVRGSTLGIYPQGHAARANVMPITSLEPLPDFCKIAQASRAWTARVADPAALADTLREAARVIREEKRQVLVEVKVGR
ncbi:MULTISPECIES: thiamine pyrophosphate-requiring protein [unclassified Sphingobium]|uniref:thiamine pyrophosphate-requiring protein n=1 Tax=unclassified Sphingobium TaxID=2611147 RepID=UPI0022250B7F|nr:MULTISPECIES: thiamine pyrophosphate-requiring protein [unclassified Sphingobium]MCW2395296.1 acetolactate synthase-1/2/3 large subunit [Sphingobium sp. B8D3B]MCW2418810.1 acetolactate synthase-1/2/3 large subunit [Sphingobium sp. B8D3C]